VARALSVTSGPMPVMSPREIAMKGAMALCVLPA
jgi:hypothetical protein